MALMSCFGVLLLSAGTLQTPAADAPLAPSAPLSGNLRWVRGLVTAASPDSLTLKLRNKDLTIALDPAADRPAVGSIVEVHYADKRGVRRAVLSFGADASSELSKRPGHSYRGVTKPIKRSSLSIRANTKSHSVNLDKRTRLVDAEGRLIANGSKAIEGVLLAGEDVVVKIESDSDGGSDKALEIRRLRA